MKSLKKFIKAAAVALTFFTAIMFSLAFYTKQTVGESYKLYSGEELDLGVKIPVTAVYEKAEFAGENLSKQVGTSFSVNLKLFGFFPVSSVRCSVVDDTYVAVLGSPFGIRLYTNGVLVVEVSDVDAAEGNVSPAKNAGIEKGDLIISVDGQKVSSNEEISKIIEASNGKTLAVEIKRESKTFTVKFTPKKSVQTGKYRAGIWVRDSSAGIGTLTFYAPSCSVAAGLGHGVYDSDTGVLLPVSGGQLVGADIFSVEKGKAGTPGELKGRFNSSLIASLDYNCAMGVYGSVYGSISADTDLVPVALKQEIKDGDAQIICTVNGEGPKTYSCKIKRRNLSDNESIQNMIIEITDERLLSLTGGIVQGMSGSPIIQNGKLIGAVTHVLIDDPTKGYAIFAETMLDVAQNVLNKEIKEAS